MDWREIIGLVAGCFILLSFLMKGVKWIRIVNIIGAIGMVIYGATINSLTTIIINGTLVIIHLIFLTRDSINKIKKESDENV